MIAAFSPGSDFKRYYRGRMPRLALIVIILMPLMYCALYLWAFWNPFGEVNKLPVAIINLDEGVTVDGERTDAGADVVTGLIESKQLDLHEVDEQEGVDGLAHGRFYFTITIPEDFSESVTSAASDNAHQAKLIFTYNDANNYLATVIGQDAAEEAINQVSAQVGEQVFQTVLGLAEDTIPKLREAAAQVDELNAGMQQANSGAQELADNLVTAKDGSATLAGALDELDDAVDDAVTRAESIVDSSGMSGTELRQVVQRVTADTDQAAAALDRVVSGRDEAIDRLDTIIAELAAGDDEVQQDFADRLTEVRDFILDNWVSQDLALTFAAIQEDVDIIAAELDNPDSRVSVILRSVENGGVQRDLGEVRAAAGQLRSGADELSSGLVKLSDGASRLAAGTPILAAGTDQLAGAVEQGLQFIPSWDNEEQGNFIKALADPVALEEVTNNEAKTFAYGFAPFFMGLGLFVGSLIAWMLFTPLQARPLAQGLGSFRVVLASYAPTLFVGILQALILFLVLYFGLGLHPVHAGGTLAFMFLMVAMFLALIQMFNALFGPAVGRVATLVFLMIMLTSAGGIYPVPVTSVPFQYLHWIDPMTFTVTGLRQLIVGGVDSRLWTSVVVIVVLTVAFLAVSTWAARRNRQYNMDRLYPPVEV
ncbi:putative membrane protein [Agromyces hippuratus]|uniref:Putative membrane protein n=2 Tax=Agromyces TaxID=33877 RepID=A0A852WWN0_9MICO|nr:MULTISPECIES: YhgE/Pip domain-containing protein [Agromyces]NYG22359.1 putative membrane protein [Agromyces hippuratus]SIO29293.1 putative membrane protein [Agromyces cerinus subsp. cerinus]